MANMILSMPDPMQDWVKAQINTGGYANAGAYIRDLIRRDQDRHDRIVAMQHFTDEGLKSGIGSRSKDELFAAARARVDALGGN